MTVVCLLHRCYSYVEGPLQVQPLIIFIPFQGEFASFPNPVSLSTVHGARPLAGAIEKDPHAQGFGALRSDQAHMPADVIAALKTGGLGFIPCGVELQAGDALLNGAAKAGTDLKPFFEAGIGIVHGVDLVSLLMAGRSEGFFFGTAQVFPTCADTSE